MEVTTANSYVPNSEKSDFYYGLSLAIVSSVFIGSSFIFKKKSLNRLSRDGNLRAGSGGFGYLRDTLWWCGLLLMGIGELANFTAYAFAPASLVTPLGALSVLVSSILAARYLNEHLNILGKIGCALCILGSTVFVIHAPKEEGVKSLDDLVEKLQHSGFMTYLAIVVTICLIIFCYVGPVYGSNYVIVYIVFCSCVGSVTVMACKGLGLALKTGSLHPHNPNGWLPLVLFVMVAFCICLQMNYLNKALDLFSTNVVTPIYYVVFTSLVIMSSAILFKEWQKMSANDIVGCACGFSVTVIAIFLLSVFKEVHTQPLLSVGSRQYGANNYLPGRIA